MFRVKLEELKNGLFKKEIFWPIAAYVYVLEFQKRGHPHVHFLIILKSGSKIRSLEAFNRIVSAELSDESENPHLFSVVVKQMMHGPFVAFLIQKMFVQRRMGSVKTTALKSSVQ